MRVPTGCCARLKFRASGDHFIAGNRAVSSLKNRAGSTALLRVSTTDHAGYGEHRDSNDCKSHRPLPEP